jgi:hypothetical protein
MLSFITPSIRVAKLPETYASIDYSGAWEMIVIGPYKPPPMPDNVRWVESWGNLTVATQLGLIEATGDFITRATDDGVYLPGTLDRAMAMWQNETDIVSLILTEGDDWNPETLDPASYRAGRHDDLKLPYISADTLLCNYILAGRKTLLEIGGWDCRFEQLSMADVDLSIRLHKYGVRPRITPFQTVKLEWMPGTSGDHGPVHFAHFEHDLPLFQEIYTSPKSLSRVRIDLDNWKQQPVKWERRFK